MKNFEEFIRSKRAEHHRLFVVLLTAILIGGAGAFHVKLHAPPYVVRGGSAILTCNHSVDRALLHKVEWLKDGDRKLFQFVRGRKPPFRNFSIPGATLDWSRSNEREIRLTGLELEASGVYSCEVSMETPIYTKPSNDELITVIQRQAEDPEVWGRKPSYVVGESLEVNCTSAPSHPPAHITWLVNGRQIQGQIYHRAGSLLPPLDTDYKFLQVYFMGNSPQEVDQRCSQNISVKRPIVEQLQTFFHRHNQLIALFKTALDHMPSDNHKIIIRADKTPAKNMQYVSMHQP